MKILIVSDTHGRLGNLTRVLSKVKPIDMLWHLGDVEGDEEQIRAMAGCEVRFVKGNNDSFSDLPREELFELGAYTVYMTHGHRNYVHWGLDKLMERTMEMGADIALFGHTHVPLIQKQYGITLVNPGSLERPRQEGHKPTFIVAELDRMGEIHFTLNILN